MTIWDRINRLECQIAEQDALIIRLTRERDNARNIAVMLEAELAQAQP
jgi:uncharacterized coiled-coil protein SlyX